MNANAAWLNIDYLTLFATMFLAICGWIVALLLQRSNAKHQHKIQVRYDIYKELLKCYEKTQAAIINVGIMYAPFSLMKSSMIPFDLKLDKQYKDTWIPYNEFECVFEGEKTWTKFVQEALNNNSGFNKQYIEFLYLFGGWEAAMEPLIKTQLTLNKEVGILKDKISKRLSELQMFITRKGNDWRRWNEKEIESILEEIRVDANTISCYLGDFMTLVHNELLSKYFKYQKPLRKTLDPNYKVLTKEGILVRLEDDYKRKLKEFLETNKF
jgi:hypothetical protein